MPMKNGELILKNKEIANTFRSTVGNLDLDHWDDHSLSQTIGSDTIDNIIKRYINHSSIKSIKANFNSFYFQFSQFLFSASFYGRRRTVIRNMKNNKSVGGEIPIQVLKKVNLRFKY